MKNTQTRNRNLKSLLKFQVKSIGSSKGLFSTGFIEQGEVIIIFSGKILLYPTRTSVQIAESQHIEDAYARYVNHSCTPTAKVVDRKLISLRNIQVGEEITFNYNDNEDVLANPFFCNCCGKKILGLKLVSAQ